MKHNCLYDIGLLAMHVTPQSKKQTQRRGSASGGSTWDVLNPHQPIHPIHASTHSPDTLLPEPPSRGILLPLLLSGVNQWNCRLP